MVAGDVTIIGPYGTTAAGVALADTALTALTHTDSASDTIEIIQMSDSNDLPESVGFEVKIPKGTNALDVLYETPHVDLGVQIVKNLNKALLQGNLISCLV